MIQRFVDISWDNCYTANIGFDPIKVLRNTCVFKSKKEFEKISNHLTEIIKWSVPYKHHISKMEALLMAMVAMQRFGTKMEVRMGNCWEKKRGRISKLIRKIFRIREYRFPVEMLANHDQLNNHFKECKNRSNIKGPKLSEEFSYTQNQYPPIDW